QIGEENCRQAKGNKLSYRVLKMKGKIKDLGLWGHHSWEKFIPKQYIYNSIENRIALLQGLFDTDGTVNKRNGAAVFYTTSMQLSLDVKELIESLGGICVITEKRTTFTYKNKKKIGRLCYCCFVRLNDPTTLFR